MMKDNGLVVHDPRRPRWPSGGRRRGKGHRRADRHDVHQGALRPGSRATSRSTGRPMAGTVSVRAVRAVEDTLAVRCRSSPCARPCSSSRSIARKLSQHRHPQFRGLRRAPGPVRRRSSRAAITSREKKHLALATRHVPAEAPEGLRRDLSRRSWPRL
ncbi:MAG: hypothetical protein MZU84_01715 [Sphingobacterium sp.]|nr:hypothetical protein [Sphingobacterium sp.]